MELEANQLYADKTMVEFGREMTSEQRKTLLQRTLIYANSLGIEGLEASLEKTAGSGLFNWRSNKALVICCPLGKLEYRSVLTLQPTKDLCVLGVYKLLLGEPIFAVNQSAEVRRRAVIDKLRQVEVVDAFFLMDKATDWVAEFLHTSVKEILRPPNS
jgi:hypothetical protein